MNKYKVYITTQTDYEDEVRAGSPDEAIGILRNLIWGDDIDGIDTDVVSTRVEPIDTDYEVTITESRVYSKIIRASSEEIAIHFLEQEIRDESFDPELKRIIDAEIVE